MLKIRKLYTGKKSTLIGSFLIMFLTATALVCISALIQRQNNIENATYLAESETKKIQYAIDSRLLNTEILEMLVISHGGALPDFERVAEQLFEDDPALRSLQLAPDGIVTYIYPQSGNEGARFDLFADPVQSGEAIRARDSGEMTLAGPQELKQGGLGFIARNPIYLEKENGEKIFWGFSTAVLNMEELLDNADLDLIDIHDYYYRIWRNNPSTGEIQIIAENTGKKFQNPVTGQVQVPNGFWHLEIIPKKGWVPAYDFLLQCVIALVIVLLSTIALAGILTILHQREELVRQTNIDPLTGIRNSRYFLNKLKELASAGTPFAIFYLDMNNFKQINDQYGHDVGDLVLKEAAERIKHSIREVDIATRIGGDEFTVTIIQNCSEEFCQNMKNRLYDNVGKMILLDEDTPYYPEISVGYARFPDNSDEIEQVIRMADQKMYDEKRKLKSKRLNAKKKECEDPQQ